MGERYVVGDVVDVSVSARNLGQAPISEFKVQLFILDRGAEKKVGESVVKRLDGLQSDLLSFSVTTAGLAKGKYVMRAALFADGLQNFVMRPFDIGSPQISVLSPPALLAGEVNSLEFNVSSDWNVPLENVSFRMATLGGLFDSQVRTTLNPGLNVVRLDGEVTKAKAGFDKAQFIIEGGSYKVFTNFDIAVEGSESFTGFLFNKVGAAVKEPVSAGSGFNYGIIVVLVVFASVGAFFVGKLFGRNH